MSASAVFTLMVSFIMWDGSHIDAETAGKYTSMKACEHARQIEVNPMINENNINHFFKKIEGYCISSGRVGKISHKRGK